MQLVKITRTHAQYNAGGRILCQRIDRQAQAILQWYWRNTTANQ